jgi:hypothetical protein
VGVQLDHVRLLWFRPFVGGWTKGDRPFLCQIAHASSQSCTACACAREGDRRFTSQLRYVPIETPRIVATSDCSSLSSHRFCLPAATSVVELVELSPTDVLALRAKFNSIVLSAGCDGNLAQLVTQIGNRLAALEQAPANSAQQNAWRTFGARDARKLRERAVWVTEVIAQVTKANALVAATERTKIIGLSRDVENFEDRLLRFVVTPQPKPRLSAILVSEVAGLLRRAARTYHCRLGQDTLAHARREESTAVRRRRRAPPRLHSDEIRSGTPLHVARRLQRQSHVPRRSRIPSSAPSPSTRRQRLILPRRPSASRKRVKKSGRASWASSLHCRCSIAQAPARCAVSAWRSAPASTPATRALYLGASWKLTRAIRIGAGRTWKQVDALNDQQIGQVLPTADGLKTKQELDSDWYASFSFSLGSLNLFKED